MSPSINNPLMKELKEQHGLVLPGSLSEDKITDRSQHRVHREARQVSMATVNRYNVSTINLGCRAGDSFAPAAWQSSL